MVLPCLPEDKFFCHSFMENDKKHKILGTETMDLITYGSAGSMNIFASLSFDLQVSWE
jgi:hypothetical protein